jgi:hypothetical protein
MSEMVSRFHQELLGQVVDVFVLPIVRGIAQPVTAAAERLQWRRYKELAMTYEEYLDEVTTLIAEKYDVADAEAIRLVVKAQDAEFFVQHDKVESLRNIDQAHKDAKTIYTAAKSAGKPRK